MQLHKTRNKSKIYTIIYSDVPHETNCFDRKKK